MAISSQLHEGETVAIETVTQRAGGLERTRLWPVCLAVLLVAAALNLPWLGRAPVADSTEARHAEVGREFAENGHWLIPTLNYHPHLTKPPLTDWVVAAGIRLFGAREFGARFGNALVAALGVALVAGFGCRLGGRQMGLAAAVLYFVCPLYLGLSRTISIDTLLATLAIGAYWAVWELSRETCAYPRLTALAWAGCLGLGVLAKGHIILLMVLAPTLIWVIYGKRRQVARRLAWPPAILLFLALAVPWYVYIMRTFPSWLTLTLDNEFKRRIVGQDYGDAFVGLSVVYFFGCVLPTLPLAFLSLVGGSERTQAENPSQSARSLLLLWITVPLAVLSLPRCQRLNYLMPLVPPMAILAAMTWSRLAANWSGATARQRFAAYLTVVILAICGPACLIDYIVLSLWTNQAAVGSIVFLAVGTAVCLFLGGACLLSLLRAQRDRAAVLFLICGAVVCALSLPIQQVAKSGRSARRTCEWVRQNLEPGSKLGLFHGYMASCNFYLGRHIDLVKVEISSDLWIEDARMPGQPQEITNGDVARFAKEAGGIWLILDRQAVHDLKRFAGKRGISVSLKNIDPEVVLAHLSSGPPMQGEATDDSGKTQDSSSSITVQSSI